MLGIGNIDYVGCQCGLLCLRSVRLVMMGGWQCWLCWGSVTLVMLEVSEFGYVECR